MDFISLAEASSSMSQFLSRQLAVLVDAADDNTNKNTMSNNTTGVMMNNIKELRKPVLSKAAEDELFMLATNFLLYVAMVLIVIMVAKIYFPESLQRRHQKGEMVRSYNYKLVEGGGMLSDDDECYSEDNDDDDDENNNYYDRDRLSIVTEEDEKQNNDNDNNNNNLLLLELEDNDASFNNHKKKTPRSRTTAVPVVTSAPINNNTLEFDQHIMSRANVLQRLVLCVVMLNLTFVTWGALQERMLTRRYPRETGEYFTYSYALVFTNRFWTLILSGMLWLYLKPSQSRSTIIYEYSFPSISNMLSSWCQYEALRYISFPAVTLFKSFKLAPVMAMGKLLGNKKYPQYDYIVAVMIGIGITMFMTGTDELKLRQNIYEESGGFKTGIMLLLLFLFFDSFTSQWQSRMFQRHRDLSMIELMFATSAYSTVLSMITLIHTKELGPAISFMYRHSEIHLHFFTFSMCSTIGQLFIFYTIKNFGAVVFTIIMTTRVLLSITLSCLLYDHKVTSTGFFGLMLVLAAVCYRIKRKVSGQQLIKWRGMGDEQAVELVQEWHEHLDT